MGESAISKLCGKQSIWFQEKVEIIGFASVAGKKEGEGPLGSYFDQVEEDELFGGQNWEDAESRMQKIAAELAIKNAGCKESDIRFLFAGDLLGQLIATSFGMGSLEIPFFGVYGACSTMGESMLLASIFVESGFADRTMALTSSHFAGAEKQFRFPLAYGSQRPASASWTVTGSGAVIIGKKREKNYQGKKNISLRIVRGTVGKIVDFGVMDSLNMGACMAPVVCIIGQ